jgi:hypothetical protein
MKRSRLNTGGLLRLVVLSLFAFGCAHKIIAPTPSRIGLPQYQTIGVVDFFSISAVAIPSLNHLATQKFIDFIQTAQPSVRFLELGPEGPLLRAVGRERMDVEAIRAIGKKYGISTVFTGRYEISEARSKVNVKELHSMNASAEVSVSMVSKQWETATGTLIWTNSRRGTWPAAGVGRNSKIPVSLNLSTPEEQYGRYLSDVAFAMTDDFRGRFEERDPSRN